MGNFLFNKPNTPTETLLLIYAVSSRGNFFLANLLIFHILCTGSGEPKDINVRYNIGTQDLIFAELSDGGGAQFEIWHDDTLAISRHRGPD